MRDGCGCWNSRQGRDHRTYYHLSLFELKKDDSSRANETLIVDKFGEENKLPNWASAGGLETATSTNK